MGSDATFRAIVVDKTADAAARQHADLRQVDGSFLPPGDVTIGVDYSSINYKDGLAIMGRPGVARTWPLIPGIDLVGTVEDSDSPDWRPGDRVILNGAGLGESHHGGLAERARVDGASLVRLPDGLTARQAAAIGTAGFTAMLSVLALERAGVEPDAGNILVTGASGGVGSVAVSLLAGAGHRVHASTGRVDELGDYLRGLGAAEIVDRATLGEPGKPLQSQRWVAAVDTVGSVTLANVLAQLVYGGVATACGLAQGSDLPATVMPFILRGVSLLGINSVEAPLPLRQEAWARLAADLDLQALDAMTTEIGLDDSFHAAQSILAGELHGRTVVDVRR